MASVAPVLGGTGQAAAHTTITPGAGFGSVTQAGTFNATAGSFLLVTVTYWSPTATVSDNIDFIQLSVGGGGASSALALNVANDPAGPFSAIGMFLVPNTFVGSGIAISATIGTNAGALPSGQPARNITIAVVGLVNTQGFAGFASTNGDGVTSSVTVAPSVANGAGTIWASCAGSTTFTTAGAGALLTNMTFNDTPAVIAAPPFAAATSTGSGGTNITSGSAAATLNLTAPAASAQIVAFVLEAEFQPADARVPAVYDVQIDNQVYLVDYSQPFYRQFSEQLDTITRTQADGGATTGENSMDPKGLWRRSQEDWRMGAGQTWLDRKQSNNQNSLPNGFHYSKGMELGVGWQAQLLNKVGAFGGTGVGFTTPKMITLQTVRGSATNVPGVIISQNAASTLMSTGFTAAGTITTTLLLTSPGTVNIYDFCTDGFNIYFVTSTGVYQYVPVYTGTNGAGGTTTQIGSGTLTSFAKIGYFNGRLIVIDRAKIWNITSTTAAALGTTNTGVNPLVYTGGMNSTWFTGVAGGLAGIYVISNTVDVNGSYNDAGQVWLITMGSDGLQLNPPQLAGAVTTGESIYSALYYLNNLILYTSLGVRCCQVNSDGSVTLGTLIQLPGPVVGKVGRTGQAPGGSPPVTFHFDMCAAGEYVYFPMTNWDLDPTQATTTNPNGITCTGTGRLDLGNFVIANLEPAWQTYVYAGYAGNNTFAPNLVTTGGTNVSGVAMACTLVPWQWSVTNSLGAQPGGVAFCYVSDGQATTPANTAFFVLETQTVNVGGFLLTGKIAYDLVDNKVLGALDIQGRNFQGIFSAISVDDEPFGVIESTVSNAGTTNLTFPLNNTGSHFEVSIGLNTQSLTSANIPTLIRWTLRGYPAPTRPIQWTIPIILNEDLGNLTGQGNGYDVRAQLETLYSLVNTGKQVTFRRGVETFVCFLSDISFLPDTPSENGNTLRSFFNGMCYVTINSLPAWQSTISAG